MFRINKFLDWIFKNPHTCCFSDKKTDNILPNCDRVIVMKCSKCSQTRTTILREPEPTGRVALCHISQKKVESHKEIMDRVCDDLKNHVRSEQRVRF